MTVKCLNETDKAEMASLYAAKLCDTDDLAQAYGVSKRTVNRVMVEQGVNHVRHYKHRTPAGHGMPIDMFEPHDDSQDIQIPETAPTPDHLLPRAHLHGEGQSPVQGDLHSQQKQQCPIPCITSQPASRLSGRYLWASSLHWEASKRSLNTQRPNSPSPTRTSSSACSTPIKTPS